MSAGHGRDGLARKRFMPDPWHQFRAGCESWNGRDREAALRSLPTLAPELHGAALPLVLARLNDWVPQVRAAAAAALPLLLRDELETAWIAALPELARLMQGQRWARDGADSRGAIEHFLLQSPSRRAALLACAPGQATRVARWLTRQSWLHGSPGERVAALAQALRGVDARLAWESLRHLQALDPDGLALPGVRAALAAARVPSLRLAGLRDDHARGRLPAADEAMALAFSRHGGTRSWLLFHAEAGLKQQVLQRAESVLDAAGPAGPRIVALQVLRALKAVSLPGHLQPALDAPQARVREVAHAIAQAVLDEAGRSACAARALADPSGRVQAVALRALRRGSATLTVAELQALVGRAPQALRPVLRAMEGYDAWTRVPAALALLAEHPLDAAAAADQLAALRLALRRSAYAPTEAQSAAVQQAAERLQQRRPALRFSRP